jgi:peptidoglycan/LPS O-acetylase OafA/YrhL
MFHRKDIDGLRAVAIVPVVLFHAGFGFSGGFVGVDVFFVISGFLITSIILSELHDGSFTYASFYERRIRRLIPPLLPVLLFSAIAAFFLLGAKEYREFSISLASTLTGWANWFFLSNVGYFDGPADTKPLLHIWSLAIEEQFYVVFPIMLALWIRFVSRDVHILVSMVFAASFLYSIYLVLGGETDQAFFNSAARFWELLVGAFLAAGLPALGRFAKLARPIGCAMIGASLFLYTKQTVFPGVTAILPVFGTALVIWAGDKEREASSAIIASRPFVEIGKVSYAWYLWHWPIIVFLPMAFPSFAKSSYALAGAAILSLLLAAISTHTIEKAVRKSLILPGRARAYSLYCIGLVTSFAIASIGVVKPLQDARIYALHGKKSELIRVLADELDHVHGTALRINWDGESSIWEGDANRDFACSFDKGNTIDRMLMCLSKQASGNNMLVIGDSVGRDTYLALKNAYPDVNFLAINHSGCAPAEHTPRGWQKIWKGSVAKCYPGLYQLLEKLHADIKIDAIILAFRFRPQTWSAISESIPKLQAYAPVVVIGAGPTFGVTMEEYLKSLPRTQTLPQSVLETDRSIVPWSFAGLTAGAKKLADTTGATFVNIHDDFCPEEKCLLWATNSDEPLFADQVHVSRFGHKFLTGVLRNDVELRRIMSHGPVGPM